MALYFYFLKRNQIDKDASGKHAKVRNLAADHVKGAAKCKQTMNILLGLRIKADYTPEEIDEDELDEALREDGNRIRTHFLMKFCELE